MSWEEDKEKVRQATDLVALVGETVVLTCPEVNRPRLVRYGWEPYTRANLVNGAGLPASTFRAPVAGGQISDSK